MVKPIPARLVWLTSGYNEAEWQAMTCEQDVSQHDSRHVRHSRHSRHTSHLNLNFLSKLDDDAVDSETKDSISFKLGKKKSKSHLWWKKTASASKRLSVTSFVPDSGVFSSRSYATDQVDAEQVFVSSLMKLY